MKFLKYILLIVFVASTSYAAQAQFGDILKKAKKVVKGENPLSKDEVADGLKEALDQGIEQAVDKLSAEDGYFKSPYKVEIPEEAKSVTSKVKRIPGFENVERDLILKMNRAAESAAKKATPIFVDSEEDTWNMSPELLEEAINEKEKLDSDLEKEVNILYQKMKADGLIR